MGLWRVLEMRRVSLAVTGFGNRLVDFDNACIGT